MIQEKRKQAAQVLRAKGWSLEDISMVLSKLEEKELSRERVRQILKPKPPKFCKVCKKDITGQRVAFCIDGPCRLQAFMEVRKYRTEYWREYANYRYAYDPEFRERRKTASKKFKAKR